VKQTSLTNYLRTRAISAPWSIEGCGEGGFSGAVVIPALAEHETLFATLTSLAANPPELLARFLVLVVVNHREDASAADRENNLRTLARLAVAPPELLPLRLAWVDAASPGLEMPVKAGGVGLARKIGLDLALHTLDHAAEKPLLICLDADTLVETTYLSALTRHFKGTATGGAAIPFHHQPGKTPEEQRAIVSYELYLRHYVLGLRLAGSPYAFHTVGSAMASTADAYIRSGGMNTRTAGEDFYFLQHLSRTCGVAPIRGTVVHPSPRPSHRVPFGTGRTVSRSLAGDDAAVTFYRPDCFRILAQWLSTVEKSFERAPDDILREAQIISVHLAEYLEDARFPATWTGLCRNHRTPDRLLRGFHGWFDGLRTMKLIHHLSARGFPRCGPEESIPELILMAGGKPVGDSYAQLELLRDMEVPDPDWSGSGNLPTL
jgi:hypothetical protein